MIGVTKMESFGINIDCDEEELKVIKKENFTNFLRDDIIDGMKVPLKDLIEIRKPYIPTPILFSRFHMLDFNTHLMEDNSIITNCKTLQYLASNKKCKYTLFPVKIAAVSKTFYIFHAENDERLRDKKRQQDYHKNMLIGKRFEETLKKEGDNFKTFECFQMKFDNPLMNIYYTHQIDLYDSQRNPIEVKAKECDIKNQHLSVEQKMAEYISEYDRLNIILQCKIGKVEKIILGFHDGNEAEIFQTNVTKLNVGPISEKVEKCISTMENGLKECFKIYQNKHKGNIVRMQHIQLRTKNEWHLTPINFEDLSSFDKEFIHAI